MVSWTNSYVLWNPVVGLITRESYVLSCTRNILGITGLICMPCGNAMRTLGLFFSMSCICVCVCIYIIHTGFFYKRV